ncbi:MAG: SH3 domain-containing protein [Saprospiraceae bacterium]
MKNVLSVFLLLFFSISSNAFPFTILAKSGLNVRKEGKMNSERVTTLPFGTVVEAEINYGTDIGYNCDYTHFSEIIEGKRGFWMKITYGKIEGYIFSGFGLVGEWVVKSTGINNAFRLIYPGPTCSTVSYDPQLHWYALIKSDGKLALKRSEVRLKLIHEFNEQDTLGAQNVFWKAYPLIIETNQSDTVLYLIGSKTNLEEGEIPAQFIAYEYGYSGDGKFLFPEQSVGFGLGGIDYQFHAFEDVLLTKKAPEGFVKKYQIELSTFSYSKSETKKYNLSQELELELPAQAHCRFKTPQLIFVGDLNKDGLSDFIYYSHTMTDGCGGCWEYHLFLSDITNPDQPFKKVANSISCNCIT